MSSQFKLRSTIKYPTSLIINGVSNLGLEIASSLLAQGGYVILVDAYSEANLSRVEEKLGSSNLVSLLDFSAIPHLQEDLRRLDYVFYLAHEGGGSVAEVSTQNFLKYSNYLDTTLSLAVKFEAKFLLSTSIKAHQMLMSRMDVDVNFGMGADAKHTVYTEMEVQRYSESLCLEYVSKTNLNARIVRLGEIIGEGIDFSADTQFVKLVLSAVTGKSLELTNDGLDTEWFVHLLDAAYGVIKAQFSKDTAGDIFSLAYDASVTHLSIAYKLQELEPLAKDITFSQADDSLPPLRLHKPAPNLSKIGWKPRVELEKAFAESLAAAKLYILKQQSSDMKEKSAGPNVVGKLKSFLSIAERNPSPAELEMLNSGPVSRLIAERRLQAQARADSIDAADTKLKNSWSDRPRTPVQRVQAWVWRNFLDVRTNFNFLRKLTPAQFVIYTVWILLAVVLYFAVISPVIVIARNSVITAVALSDISGALQARNIDEIYAQSKVISTSLKENQDILSRYQGAAKLIAVDKYLNALTSTITQWQSAAEGVSEISYAMQPLSEYVTKYRTNTRYRLNNETYVAVTDSGTDYSVILDELSARKPYIEAGSSKLQQAVLQMDEQDLEIWPQFITNIFRNVQSQIANFATASEMQNLGTYANEVLGNQALKTYVIVLVDNSRPMPIGGNLAAYMLVTVQNGSLVDVRIQSIDAFSPDVSNLPNYVIADINLTAYPPKKAKGLSVKDLGYITDYSLFGQAVQQVWGKVFNRQVDGVVVANLNFVSDMLDKLGSVNIEKEDFTSQSLLASLQTLQGSTPTIARRDDLIAQVWGTLMQRFLEGYGQYFWNMQSVLADNALSKNVIFVSDQLDFAKVVESVGADGQALKLADMPVSFGLIADSKTISPSRYPAVNMASKVTINSDSSLNYAAILKFPSLTNVDQVVLCTSLAAKNFRVDGIDSARVHTVNANNKTCVIADVVTETEISYSWATIPFETSTGSEYNLVLGYAKDPGTELIGDFEIALSAGHNFLNVSPNLAVVGGKIVFTQTLDSDLLVKLKIK